MYSTMLEHMSDEHKITVTAKLAQEVLSAAIDGGLPLAASSAASNTTPGGNSAAFSSHNKRNSGRAAAGMDARQKASAVVKDALMVMASPGIRVGARRGGADGDFDDGVGKANIWIGWFGCFSFDFEVQVWLGCVAWRWVFFSFCLVCVVCFG